TSCASLAYSSVEWRCSLRMLQDVEKFGQLPAACQVEPEVSSSRSSSTTSVQPSLVRWYSTLQPTAPPPMTATRVWLFIYALTAALAARSSAQVLPYAPRALHGSLFHPLTRRVVE